MKIRTIFMVLLYIIFLISGSPQYTYGQGEQIVVVGADKGWNAVENWQGITELADIRPYPVLVLSSAMGTSDQEPGLDLAVSFDEEQAALFADQIGHYQVEVSEGVTRGDRRLARFGRGAALFSGVRMQIPGAADTEYRGPLRITPRKQDALFAPGQIIRDFTLEFWFLPSNMENGEQIVSWTASNQKTHGQGAVQRIQCIASKNRLQWNFLNFFSLDDTQRISVSLQGSTHLVPKTWSHHLIRFDADTGLLEYLVNGYPEAMVYTTENAREGGQVYYPVIGEEGSFVLGSHFMGLLDEFKLYNSFVAEPVLRKYPKQGGWMETLPLDLGEPNSSVLMVEASGGRTSNTGAILSNEYTENGYFRFADNSAVQFFIRAADSRYSWIGRAETEWQPFIPGTALSGIKGRFVQIRAVFYPSGDGETTPYLEQLRIFYQPDEPPQPPTLFTAIARDGAVDLSWKHSYESDVAGYLVYYGTASGEYFGEGAILGSSPINVGKRNSVHIDGLRNGTLYYFTVVAYDRFNPLHIGVFSREITARPLRMIE